MTEGKAPRQRPIVLEEHLNTAVDELLALGRERGQELRRARSGPPTASLVRKPDIGARLRRDLEIALHEYRTYSDERLVEIAWGELASLPVSDTVKDMLIEDLREAERQLHQPSLSAEGRGRLRRFVVSARLRSPEAVSPGM